LPGLQQRQQVVTHTEELPTLRLVAALSHREREYDSYDFASSFYRNPLDPNSQGEVSE